jgi:hypothetical protein
LCTAKFPGWSWDATNYELSKDGKTGYAHCGSFNGAGGEGGGGIGGGGGFTSSISFPCQQVPAPVNPATTFSCANAAPSFTKTETNTMGSATVSISCTSTVSGKDVNTAGRYFWDLIFTCSRVVTGDNTDENGTSVFPGATVACGDKKKFTNGDEKDADTDINLTDTTLGTNAGNAAGLSNNIAVRTGVSACHTGCASLVALSDGSFGVSSSCVNSAKAGALR